jgi:hypothetical protein
MRAVFRTFVAGAIATIAMGGAASATGMTSYNDTLASPGFYAGSGNPQTGFTVYTNNGVEIGLGVHYRHGANVLPSPTTGSVYTVQDGGQPCYTTTCALWNFDFSVNLQAASGNAGLHLSDITSLMTLTKVGGNTVSFDPLSAYPDSAGWNGAKNYAIDYESTDWGFQNSENFGWSLPGFNPYLAGTYNVELSVTQKSTGESLGSVSETINAVPSPGTLPLFASGLGIICLVGWRRKRRSVVAMAEA